MPCRPDKEAPPHPALMPLYLSASSLDPDARRGQMAAFTMGDRAEIAKLIQVGGDAIAAVTILGNGVEALAGTYVLWIVQVNNKSSLALAYRPTGKGWELVTQDEGGPTLPTPCMPGVDARQWGLLIPLAREQRWV